MSCNDYFADCCDCCGGGTGTCCPLANLTMECGTEDCYCCTPTEILFIGGGGAGAVPLGDYDISSFFVSDNAEAASIFDYIVDTVCQCPERLRYTLTPIGDFDVYFDFYCGEEGPIWVDWDEIKTVGLGCTAGLPSELSGCIIRVKDAEVVITITITVGCIDNEGVITWS